MACNGKNKKAALNPFGHIDLRVTSFTEALPFYEALLPALGFTRTFPSAQWRVFTAEGDLPSVPYVAFTEDPRTALIAIIGTAKER